MKILNLGCGDKKMANAINVDISEEYKPDMLLDLNKLPYPFPNESIDEIYCSAALEHLNVHTIDFFRECHRILKRAGKLHFETSNSFHYRRRLKYLFGSFDLDIEWHPYHSKLIKPSYLLRLLKHIGFHPTIEPSSTVKFLEVYFPDLFADKIVIHCFKNSLR